MKRFLALLCLAAPAYAEPVHAPIALVGRAHDYQFTHNWNQYYWRDDFSFILDPEKGGPSVQIISREPTPAYHWRLGTTYTHLPVDWKSRPRVRVYGVTGMDRLPADYYGKKFEDAKLVTAHAVWASPSGDNWKPFYVNNWFHSWGAAADAAAAKIYANQPAPFDIYGFIKGQVLPFSPASQSILGSHPDGKMFHGQIKGSGGVYRIELVNVIAQDKNGNGSIVYGNPASIPALEEKKP